MTDLKHDYTADIVQLFAKKQPVSVEMSAFFSHWRLEAHFPLHCHPEYWWGRSHWCPHQPKYWWGYVPGIPGGVDAYAVSKEICATDDVNSERKWLGWEWRHGGGSTQWSFTGALLYTITITTTICTATLPHALFYCFMSRRFRFRISFDLQLFCIRGQCHTSSI